MAIARQLSEALAAFRDRSLTGTGKADVARRATFLQLSAAAREQTKVIISLSTRLRLTPQSRTRKENADTQARREPGGPRPWDERHN